MGQGKLHILLQVEGTIGAKPQRKENMVLSENKKHPSHFSIHWGKNMSGVVKKSG